MTYPQEQPSVNKQKRVFVYPRSKQRSSLSGPVVIEYSDLVPYFNYPQPHAANKLGICCTTMKKVCRKLGIERWPHTSKASDNQSLPSPPIQRISGVPQKSDIPRIPGRVGKPENDEEAMKTEPTYQSACQDDSLFEDEEPSAQQIWSSGVRDCLAEVFVPMLKNEPLCAIGEAAHPARPPAVDLPVAPTFLQTAFGVPSAQAGLSMASMPCVAACDAHNAVAEGVCFRNGNDCPVARNSHLQTTPADNLASGCADNHFAGIDGPALDGVSAPCNSDALDRNNSEGFCFVDPFAAWHIVSDVTISMAGQESVV